MSIRDIVDNAKSTTWLVDGMTQEEVKECIDNGKIKCAVLKALEEVKTFVDDEDIMFWNLAEKKKLIGFIDRKIAEVTDENICR